MTHIIDWATFPTYRIIANATASGTTSKLSVTVPTGYKYFRVKFVIFATFGTATNYVRMRFNNDTTSSYARSDGASIDTQDGIVGSVLSTSGYITFYELDFVSVAGKNTPYILRGGSRDTSKNSNGEWLKTSPVTSVSFDSIANPSIGAGSFIVVEAMP